MNAQSQKWDVENHFLEFGQALDTLDLIADGLVDDPKLENVLNALHGKLSAVFLNTKANFHII